MSIERNTFTGGPDFSRFGARKSVFGKEEAPASERPKAQFWLNLGYETDDEARPFVSLPQGIALDTQEKEKTNSSNKDYAAFNAAKNNLLDQLLEAAASLAPGESMIVPLQIELRRVNGEQSEVPMDQNKYARKLFG